MSLALVWFLSINVASGVEKVKLNGLTSQTLEIKINLKQKCDGAFV